MQRFYSSNLIQTGVGPRATVTVYNSSGAVATIYSASDPLLDPTASIGNPLTADDLGQFSFAALDGVYTARVSLKGYTSTINGIVIETYTGTGLSPGSAPITDPKFLGTIYHLGSATPAPLAGVLLQTCEKTDSFIQNNIQNTSTGVNASSDWICTADTGTDSSNYIDCGINNSNYNVGTWTINGALDGYHYTQSSNFAIGTATAGKNLVLFTGGTLLANSRMVVSDTQILLQVPYASTAKTVFNNGATTTYTFPTTSDYVYLTTTAASLAVTWPAAAAAIDGQEKTFVPSAAVATGSFTSSGATFVAGPSAFVANQRYSFKYHHATLQWLPC